MSVFILLCAAMIVVAVGWVAWPILKPAADVDVERTRKERRIVVVVLALLVPVAAVLLYVNLTTWRWNDPEVAKTLAVRDELEQLQTQARDNPNDAEAWSRLGRAYGAMGHYEHATSAFERAYTITKGEDADAVANLGEALALADAANMEGRAGQLFERALALEPGHPKALFYGSVSAMRSGNLAVARDRLKALLAQNPPEKIRPALERQIQDLESQMAEGSAPPAPEAGQRVVRVNVKIAPALQPQLRDIKTLFVLARDANAGGPPLAAERHPSAAIPLTVDLTEEDAMMPSRTIAASNELAIVARLSRSGTPQQQPGDYFGEVRVTVDPAREIQTYVVDVTIDRQVQ